MTHNLARYGRTALVTGASSGIGEIFAREIARAGLDVVIVARRKDRLEKLASELSTQFGVRVFPLAVDLSSPNSVSEVSSGLATMGLSIDVLVNNAGYGLLGDLATNDPAGEIGMVDLNCRAVVGLTRQLLPGMKDKKKGAVIILSSVVGTIPVPWFSTYSATKAFDLYFGEALHAELVGSGVDVLTVLPGLTDTEFQAVSGASSKRDYTSSSRSAQQVVETALGALGRKAMVVDGITNKLLVHGSRFLPRAVVIRLSRMVMRRELRLRS